MTISTPPARDDLDLAAIRLDLEIAETTRARQLAQLSPTSDDMVAILHRESVERLLGRIRDALIRIDKGGFGTCTGCGQGIPAARLDLRPWVATCIKCADR